MKIARLIGLLLISSIGLRAADRRHVTEILEAQRFSFLRLPPAVRMQFIDEGRRTEHVSQLLRDLGESTNIACITDQRLQDPIWILSTYNRYRVTDSQYMQEWLYRATGERPRDSIYKLTPFMVAVLRRTGRVVDQICKLRAQNNFRIWDEEIVFAHELDRARYGYPLTSLIQAGSGLGLINEDTSSAINNSACSRILSSILFASPYYRSNQMRETLCNYWFPTAQLRQLSERLRSMRLGHAAWRSCLRELLRNWMSCEYLPALQQGEGSVIADIERFIIQSLHARASLASGRSSVTFSRIITFLLSHEFRTHLRALYDHHARDAVVELPPRVGSRRPALQDSSRLYEQTVNGESDTDEQEPESRTITDSWGREPLIDATGCGNYYNGESFLLFYKREESSSHRPVRDPLSRQILSPCVVRNLLRHISRVVQKNTPKHLRNLCPAQQRLTIDNLPTADPIYLDPFKLPCSQVTSVLKVVIANDRDLQGKDADCLIADLLEASSDESNTSCVNCEKLHAAYKNMKRSLLA